MVGARGIEKEKEKGARGRERMRMGENVWNHFT